VKALLHKGATLIVLGEGGVGKTTVAAALAMAAARMRLATAVITVDPTRRLRDALGLHRLGGRPLRLWAKLLRQAGLDPTLELSAMVLDVKGAWDGLVTRLVNSPSARRRILENAFYRNLAGRFAGADAYAALERVYDLHEAGGFDIEIVDTPPTSQALDFVKAPVRLMRLLDSGAARWLFAPPATASAVVRLGGRAARAVVTELERFAGGAVLSSVSDFFAAAADSTSSIVARRRKTESLLRAPSTHFILVTTADADRREKTLALVDEACSEGLRPGAVVVNRFLSEPARWEFARARDDLPAYVDDLRALRRAQGQRLAPSGLEAVLGRVEGSLLAVADALGRIRRFSRQLPPDIPVALAPEMVVSAGSLATLAKLGRYLTEDAASALCVEARARRGAPGAVCRA
jgi:anion-transporting  ArsA/GET3 family ATPase